MNYHVTGSIRLGHSKERLQEFQRVAAWAATRAWISKSSRPTRSPRAIPFETHDLTGALYDPNDGDIDPAQLTQALAKGARDLGREDLPFLPGHRRAPRKRRVGDFDRKGRDPLRIVVNAAGYYAREVGKWFGRDVPMMVMSHQYMLFDEVPEVAAWSAEAGHKLPLCAMSTVPTTSGRKRTASTSAPMSATARRTGPTPRSDARGFLVPALSRRSRAAGMVHQRRHASGCRSWAPRG
jgi:dimethylglycine dehydrogenase